MFKKAKENKKGFTLAELLIVVAIIAVLVAISIPIFTSQLEKSRDAVTMANVRAAYAEASAEVLTSQTAATGASDLVSTSYNVVVKGKSGDGTAFTGTDLPFNMGNGVAAALDKAAAGSETIKVTFTWTVTDGNAAQKPTCNLATN